MTQGGRRTRERQRDSSSQGRNGETARLADLERPVGRETRGTKVLEEASQPLTPSLPSLVPQTGNGNLRFQIPHPQPLLPRTSADLRGRSSGHSPSPLLPGPYSKSNSRRKRDVSQGERKKESGPLVAAQETPRARVPLHPSSWLHRAGPGRGRTGEGQI